jgi:uncharacterized membrane protein YbaN (DUF454 family)
MARFEPRSGELAGRFWRPLLISAGALLVAIGAIGIFVPLLPTTVFLLLAGVCFGKSSPGAHRWLMTNRLFGQMLRDYHEGRGATLQTKVTSIATLWLGLAVTMWFVRTPWIDAGLVAIGIAVSVHLLRLRTVIR